MSSTYLFCRYSPFDAREAQHRPDLRGHQDRGPVWVVGSTGLSYFVLALAAWSGSPSPDPRNEG